MFSMIQNRYAETVIDLQAISFRDREVMPLLSIKFADNKFNQNVKFILF